MGNACPKVPGTESLEQLNTAPQWQSVALQQTETQKHVPTVTSKLRIDQGATVYCSLYNIWEIYLAKCVKLCFTSQMNPENMQGYGPRQQSH